MPEFTKKCGNPECNEILIYKERYKLKNAIANGTKCRKCATKKTEEHKQKISDALKLYRQNTTAEEHFGGAEKYAIICKNHGDILRGRKRPPFSAEWKAKMSETRKTSKVYQDWMKSDEYREKRRRIAVENHHADVTFEEWLETTDERQIYYRQVMFYTEKQDLYVLENYEKRGMAGIYGAYHLDHIIPISYGFKHQIAPEIIGDIANLQMLPWLENILKSNKYEGNNENLREINNNNSGNT